MSDLILFFVNIFAPNYFVLYRSLQIYVWTLRAILLVVHQSIIIALGLHGMLKGFIGLFGFSKPLHRQIDLHQLAAYSYLF